MKMIDSFQKLHIQMQKMVCFTRHSLHKKEILSTNDFNEMIKNQCLRCIRKHNEFSVIVYIFDDNNYKFLNKYIYHIVKRKRKTDIIGLIDKYTIGLYLPDTDICGAQHFDLTEQEDLSKYGCIHSEIYSFPRNWIIDNRISTYYPYMATIRKHHNLMRLDYKSWKRHLDFVGAAIACILCFPLFLAIALYIKTVSRGPVFFTQQRLGFMSRAFPCYKFRSMETTVDPEQHRQHVCQLIIENKQWVKLDAQHNAGVIPGGHIFRILGLDELPQLFNILRGEMSFIGPRPCLPYEADDLQVWQQRRFHCYPGLTGLWQTHGKNRTTFVQMLRYDISYIDNMSLWNDFIILISTVPALVQQTVSYAAKRKAHHVETN